MKTFKTFYLLWTYIGNYSRLMPVQATSAEDALAMGAGYGGEFAAKASIFVFDKPPVLISYKGTHFVGRKRVENYRNSSKGDG